MRAQLQTELERDVAGEITTLEVERTQVDPYITTVLDIDINSGSIVAHEPSEYYNKGQEHHN